MSRAKKVISSLLVTALMVPTVAVSAATPSVTKTKLEAANVSVTGKTVTYDGKEQSVDVTVTADGKTLVEGTDYILAVPTVTNAGTYSIDVKVIGLGHYEGTVEKTVTVKIKKKAQTLTGTKAKKVKKSKVKKKAVKVKLNVKSTGAGKLTYKRVSKRLKVSKKGVVTIKKGTKKGTYYVKVRAKATTNYKGTKFKKIKITVK